MTLEITQSIPQKISDSRVSGLGRIRSSVGRTCPQLFAYLRPVMYLFLLAISLPLLRCDVSAEPERKNVLLITLDGLRQDHVSYFGYGRETTPNIDWLAGRGIAYDTIISEGTHTKPSLTSLLTSVGYATHQLEHVDDVLSPEYVTLSEVFQASGYATACVSGTVVLGKTTGFSQGYDSFEDFSGREKEDYIQAPQVTDEALTFIEGLGGDRADRPFFMHIHYEEPHPPWFPPSPWLPNRDEDYRIRPFDTGCTHVPTDESYVEALRDKKEEWIAMYDGAILQADKQIGRILKQLEKSGFLENTIIAVSTDHGYELLDRYSTTHAYNPFDEVAKVFLVLFDGSRQSWAMKTGGIMGRTVDIAPTLLGAAGIPAPADYQGVDLVKHPESLPKYAFTRGRGSDSVRTLTHKFVHVDFQGKQRKPGYFREFGDLLFNVAVDPAESADVKASEPEVFDELMGVYASQKALMETNAKAKETVELNAAEEERLRALGYIE